MMQMILNCFMVHLIQAVRYGFAAGTLITFLALLKSNWFLSGSNPDLFLTVVAGLFAAGGVLLHFFLTDHKKSATQTEGHHPVRLLSKREEEVFGKLLQNKSNKEIAAELHVEVSTIKTHINSIYRKLEVASRKEMLDKYTKNAAVLHADIQ